MGLSRRVLATSEEVVYEARPHWIALSRPALAVGAVVAVMVGTAVAYPRAPIVVGQVMVGIGALAALWLAARVLRWRRRVLAVTTLRIIERSGVLSRRGDDIRLDRIAELASQQSLVGVVLGFGRLVVDLGAGGRVVLGDVRRPARLQGIVTEQITASRRAWTVASGGGRNPGGGSGDWDRGGDWRSDGEQQRGSGDWDRGGDWRSDGEQQRGSGDWDRGSGDWDRGSNATPPAGVPVTGMPANGTSVTGSWVSGAPVSGRLDATVVPGGLGAGGAVRERPVAERLQILRDLHGQGLVSDEEYAAKRAELLRQL